MGLFDRVQDSAGMQRAPMPGEPGTADDQAIARYRYMLRTAPPETIEQAHAEAFAKLTPEQRRKVLEELASAAPEGERDAVLRAGDAPGSLARAATRAEIRQPGIMERMFGGGSAQGTPMPGFGSMLGHAFLGSLAGTVLGSMVAQHFLNAHPPSAQTLADLSPASGLDDSQLGAFDTNDSSAATQDDAGSNDDVGTSGDVDFGDGGDFDLGDTFDV
jgi:hypothetical protein